MATVDRLYRKILAATRFFSNGWGPESAYERYGDYKRTSYQTHPFLFYTHTFLLMFPHSLLELFPYLNNRSSITSLLADHTHPITTAQVTP